MCSPVCTLIDNGELANQIARLVAIVVKIDMINFLHKQKAKSRRKTEIFERHMKLQADPQQIRGSRDSIKISIGLNKIGIIQDCTCALS